MQESDAKCVVSLCISGFPK